MLKFRPYLLDLEDDVLEMFSEICRRNQPFFYRICNMVFHIFFLQFFQIWNAVSLQTLHILGRGEARRAFSAISFSKVTRGPKNQKYLCSVFRTNPFPMLESCLRNVDMDNNSPIPGEGIFCFNPVSTVEQRTKDPYNKKG
jgi:hypothetical protein